MLQTQAQHQSKINWADLYLMAESEAEPFADVRVVTARSEFDRLVAEQMFSYSEQSPFGATFVLDVEVRESVTLSTDGEFSVVINTPDVSDDAVWKAMDMVAEAMNVLDGHAGVVYFSQPIRFNKQSNPSITLH